MSWFLRFMQANWSLSMQEGQTRGEKIAKVVGGKKAWTLKAYTLHTGGVALFAGFPVHPFSAHRARSSFSNPSLLCFSV